MASDSAAVSSFAIAETMLLSRYAFVSSYAFASVRTTLGISRGRRPSAACRN
jgi:hypothetical protein